MSMFANRKDRTLYVYDGAANFIVAFILQMILQLLFSLIVMSIMTVDERSAFTNTAVYVIILTVINEVGFLITPASYSKVLGQNFYKDMGFNKKINVLQIGLLILIAIATICAFLPIASAVANLFLKAGFKSNLQTISMQTPSDLVVGVFILSLLPAVTEEILFRGMIARSFTRKNYVFAVFMGGFMFAIMHGTPVQFVHQFFLGIVCCVVYFASGSIYASMVVHFTNNLVSILGTYAMNKTAFVIPLYGQIIMAVVGLVTLPILLYVFILLKNKDAKLSRGFKAFNAVFAECFEKPVENNKQELINAAIKDSGIEEIQEVYEQRKIVISQDEALKSRRAMILAIFFALFVFVVNTITGFLNK